MQYVLTGFTTDMGVRVFSFEGVGADFSRTPYQVRADLAMARKCGIRLQELPLLCHDVLEQRIVNDSEHRSFTCTEAEMCHQATLRAAEAEAEKLKRHPKHSNPNTSG